MAKRFADTKLSREKWFRLLKPAMKCAVRFLFDECDEAGVWSIDEDAMEFYVGEPVSIDELIKVVQSDGKARLRRIGLDKIYIPGFVPFQYGKLSPSCKPHQKAISRLQDLNLWEPYLDTLRYPLQRVKEEEEDKEEEEEKEEGGVGETKPPAVTPPPETFRNLPKPTQPIDAEGLDLCQEAWKETLRAFKAPRTLLPAEQTMIARSIQRHGQKATVLALEGARYEPKNEKFDPGKFLSLQRVLDDQANFQRFLNLGTQERVKRMGSG